MIDKYELKPLHLSYHDCVPRSNPLQTGADAET
jgi:hypothetical protein